MKTLYIDTTLNDVIICLLINGKLKEHEIIEGQRFNSQFIMPTIKKVLNDEMPEEIIVVNGPGSFTGVRLGVTVAKTLAYTLNIPIKTITSLEQMAFSINLENKIIGISDNNGYYVGIFDEKNSLVGNYEYLNNEQYEKFTINHTVITSTEINYNSVYKYLKNRESINPHVVKPLYIKKISVQND